MLRSEAAFWPVHRRTRENFRPVPHLHQQENHLIDYGYYWVKQGTVSWGDLLNSAEESAGPLRINGYSSTHGYNDRNPGDLPGVECALNSTCAAILTVLLSLIHGWSRSTVKNMTARSSWRRRYSV